MGQSGKSRESAKRLQENRHQGGETEHECQQMSLPLRLADHLDRGVGFVHPDGGAPESVFLTPDEARGVDLQFSLPAHRTLDCEPGRVVAIWWHRPREDTLHRRVDGRGDEPSLERVCRSVHDRGGPAYGRDVDARVPSRAGDLVQREPVLEPGREPLLPFGGPVQNERGLLARESASDGGIIHWRRTRSAPLVVRLSGSLLPGGA